MLRTDLIDRIATRSRQLAAKDAEVAVKLILDAMTTTLANGNRIEIRGFGTFALTYRPSRNGRNPKTGAQVAVPAKYVPHFKAGRDLRGRVQGATELTAAIKKVA